MQRSFFIQHHLLTECVIMHMNLEDTVYHLLSRRARTINGFFLGISTNQDRTLVGFNAAENCFSPKSGTCLWTLAKAYLQRWVKLVPIDDWQPNIVITDRAILFSEEIWRWNSIVYRTELVKTRINNLIDVMAFLALRIKLKSYVMSILTVW